MSEQFQSLHRARERNHLEDVRLQRSLSQMELHKRQLEKSMHNELYEQKQLVFKLKCEVKDIKRNKKLKRLKKNPKKKDPGEAAMKKFASLQSLAFSDLSGSDLGSDRTTQNEENKEPAMLKTEREASILQPKKSAFLPHIVNKARSQGGLIQTGLTDKQPVSVSLPAVPNVKVTAATPGSPQKALSPEKKTKSLKDVVQLFMNKSNEDDPENFPNLGRRKSKIEACVDRLFPKIAQRRSRSLERLKEKENGGEEEDGENKVEKAPVREEVEEKGIEELLKENVIAIADIWVRTNFLFKISPRPC